MAESEDLGSCAVLAVGSFLCDFYVFAVLFNAYVWIPLSQRFVPPMDNVASKGLTSYSSRPAGVSTTEESSSRLQRPSSSRAVSPAVLIAKSMSLLCCSIAVATAAAVPFVHDRKVFDDLIGISHISMILVWILRLLATTLVVYNECRGKFKIPVGSLVIAALIGFCTMLTNIFISLEVEHLEHVLEVFNEMIELGGFPLILVVKFWMEYCLYRDSHLETDTKKLIVSTFRNKYLEVIPIVLMSLHSIPFSFSDGVCIELGESFFLNLLLGMSIVVKQKADSQQEEEMLELVLNDEKGFKELARFLKESLCTEMAVFLKDTALYKSRVQKLMLAEKRNATDLSRAAKKELCETLAAMRSTYIITNSSMQQNLSSQMREKVYQDIEDLIGRNACQEQSSVSEMEDGLKDESESSSQSAKVTSQKSMFVNKFQSYQRAVLSDSELESRVSNGVWKSGKEFLTVLDSAEKEVFGLLREGPFVRFSITATYHDLVEYFRSQNTKRDALMCV